MALHTERFFITNSTPDGLAQLDANERLQAALDVLVRSPRAEEVALPDTRLLGSGKFARTLLIGGVAVKISTPTSSKRAIETRRPHPPEDLGRQFTVLDALWSYFKQRRDGFCAPRQYFVSRTPDNTFILAQQFMAGWTSLSERAFEVYGYEHAMGDAKREHQQAFDTHLLRRVVNELRGFELRSEINDLVQKKTTPAADGTPLPAFHGGNILVPAAAALDEQTPICIIDQPGYLADSGSNRVDLSAINQ